MQLHTQAAASLRQLRGQLGMRLHSHSAVRQLQEELGMRLQSSYVDTTPSWEQGVMLLHGMQTISTRAWCKPIISHS
eukprot:1139077-Pelagomonas_calceolata.AAC.8